VTDGEADADAEVDVVGVGVALGEPVVGGSRLSRRPDRGRGAGA
jgi:hypothetical protein